MCFCNCFLEESFISKLKWFGKMVNQSLPFCGLLETSKALGSATSWWWSTVHALIAQFINRVHDWQLLMIVCAISVLFYNYLLQTILQLFSIINHCNTGVQRSPACILMTTTAWAIFTNPEICQNIFKPSIFNIYKNQLEKIGYFIFQAVRWVCL